MLYLKPCPFCGNPDIKVQSGTNVDCMTQYNGRYVYCLGCGTFKQVTRYSEWNNRATTKEKKLNSIQQIKAKIRSLMQEFEDLYDGDLSGEAVALFLTELHKLSAF